MLRVTYEAVRLERGRLADIEEDRGRIRFRLDRAAPLADVVRQLNIEIDRFLSISHWFQLWKDEIISRGTPDCSLRVVYALRMRQPGGAVIRENRGLVTIDIDPALSVTEFAAAMVEGSRQFLDGGQWFQLYAGEIIDMTPEKLTGV
jgi:hypothetical protein